MVGERFLKAGEAQDLETAALGCRSLPQWRLLTPFDLQLDRAQGRRTRRHLLAQSPMQVPAPHALIWSEKVHRRLLRSHRGPTLNL